MLEPEIIFIVIVSVSIAGLIVVHFASDLAKQKSPYDNTVPEGRVRPISANEFVNAVKQFKRVSEAHQFLVQNKYIVDKKE